MAPHFLQPIVSSLGKIVGSVSKVAAGQFQRNAKFPKDITSVPWRPPARIHIYNSLAKLVWKDSPAQHELFKGLDGKYANMVFTVDKNGYKKILRRSYRENVIDGATGVILRVKRDTPAWTRSLVVNGVLATRDGSFRQPVVLRYDTTRGTRTKFPWMKLRLPRGGSKKFMDLYDGLVHDALTELNVATEDLERS